jgi:polyisoprenoid-binding protein YceI
VARYEICGERSRVVIKARSSLHPIDAECRGLEGFVEVDLGDDGAVRPGDAKGHLELPTSRLSSGNPLSDGEMRRRVDARRFPTISGELTSLEKAESAGRYRVGGDVTFHGVTRSYEDEMTIASSHAGVLVLTGSHVFDVRDFGVEPPKLAMLRVHPDVRVEVEIVAEIPS